MPPSSARFRRYSSPSRGKASGGERLTKLCASSEGRWREVCMGETGDGCCVGPDGGLEILSVPEVRLALSGKIMGVWVRGKKQRCAVKV